jgi:hypothetical protein
MRPQIVEAFQFFSTARLISRYGIVELHYKEWFE